MDDYPEAIAPAFEESGAVATPFEEWWALAQPSLSGVPEDAARHWIHEHWGHSPYSWISSASVDFTKMSWPINELGEVRSRWCDLATDMTDCLEHGRHLLKIKGYRTAAFMSEHRVPPARLIMLDNRGGDWSAGKPGVPPWEDLPRAVILIEGHRRFNLCLALAEHGRLNDVPVWLMTRRTGS